LILFVVVPVTIALTQHRAMRVVAVGLAVITLWELVFSPFHGVAGVAELAHHLAGE